MVKNIKFLIGYMVVEAFINSARARKQPILLVFLGVFYTFLGVILALWVIPSRTSIGMIFFIAMASIPLLVRLLKEEEIHDEIAVKKRHHILIREHKRIFEVFFFLFCGFTIGFVFLFIFLPAEFAPVVFNDQILTIQAIRGSYTGRFFDDFNMFFIIFSNNLKVLFFCLLFSFIFGSGAIFILAWNASVIGVAIGDLIRILLERYSNLSYAHIIGLGFGRYILHGIPEIGAYLLGGIAGGILSTMLIRNNVSKRYFSKILYDAMDLIIFAILLLFFAGLIEISISPLIRI